MTINSSFIVIPESAEKLLDECDVETFRSGGKGGQHVNTTDSAVRLRHRPSGVVTTSQAERSQHRNKATALYNLRRKLERLNVSLPPRIPTRATNSSKQRMLKEKMEHSKKKRLRARASFDDE